MKLLSEIVNEGEKCVAVIQLLRSEKIKLKYEVNQLCIYIRLLLLAEGLSQMLVLVIALLF